MGGFASATSGPPYAFRAALLTARGGVGAPHRHEAQGNRRGSPAAPAVPISHSSPSPWPLPEPTFCNYEPPNNIHNASCPSRHVRHGLGDPLAGGGLGHADARARRRRVRRGRGGRVRAAADRSAAPERPRAAATCQWCLGRADVGAPRVLCAQGPAPGSGHHGALRRSGPRCRATGLLAAVVPGAFDGWMQLVRDFGTLRLRGDPRARDRLRGRRLPGRARAGCRGRSARGAFPRRVAVVGRGVAARRRAARLLYALPGVAATYRRIVEEASGRDREAEFDAARDAFYRGFVADAIDRLRLAGARRRPGALERLVRGPGRARLRRADRVQAGSLEPGTGVPAAARAARPASTLPAMTPAERLHTVVECAQARVRRSRGVVRRPGVRRRAAALRCCRSPTTPSVARWSARRPRSRCGPARPAGASRCSHWAASAAGASSAPAGSDTCGGDDRRRPVRERRVGDPERRVAEELAGDPGARLLPRHARRRCSGSTRASPGALAPGKRPRTTLSPRPWRCATASPTSRSGRRAATRQDQWSLQFLLSHLGRARPAGGDGRAEVHQRPRRRRRSTRGRRDRAAVDARGGGSARR